jgi:hypothetical protein
MPRFDRISKNQNKQGRNDVHCVTHQCLVQYSETTKYSSSLTKENITHGKDNAPALDPIYTRAAANNAKLMKRRPALIVDALAGKSLPLPGVWTSGSFSTAEPSDGKV